MRVEYVEGSICYSDLLEEDARKWSMLERADGSLSLYYTTPEMASGVCVVWDSLDGKPVAAEWSPVILERLPEFVRQRIKQQTSLMLFSRANRVEFGRVIGRQYALGEMSELGALVAHFWDVVLHGFHHFVPSGQVDWANAHFVEVKLRGSFATFDFDYLTRIVIAAHDYALRVEISPCNFQLLTFRFHLRQRAGRMPERHPTIAEAVAYFRGRA